MTRKRQRTSHPPNEIQGLRLTRSKACTECKTQKTKCETNHGETSCSRCLRHGLECVSYDVSQQFLQSDMAWKNQTTEEVGLLRAAVQHLLRHTQQPELSSFASQTSPSGRSDARVEHQDAAIDMSRENSPQPQENGPTGLITAPMRSLYELTRLKTLRNNPAWKPRTPLIDEDFISQGVVSVEEADFLFNQFVDSNNRMLWDGALLLHRTLDSVRRSSSLLTAVIFTVGALHTPGRTEAFHQSYNVFVSLASSLSLSRHHSLDDIRALCIGAFYLANLSWKLSGQAIRIAAEIGLHQSYHRLMQGERNQMEHVRLWYATYVCDHQFSIAHGRPPAAVNDESIRNIELFLSQEGANNGDARLAAQVSLFATLTEAYMAFGSDPNRPLDQQDIEKLRVFNVAVEQWKLQWVPRSENCVILGSYPSKALVLYYHFARFQLNSLALRGVAPPGPVPTDLSLGHREAANKAIAAAMATLTLILEEIDLRLAFPNVPIFTYTMVAFCATFLLKMAATWGRDTAGEVGDGSNRLGLMIDTRYIVSLVQQSADMLAGVAASLNEKHLAKHIAAGMLEMLQQFHSLDKEARNTFAPVPDLNTMPTVQGMPDETAFWAGEYNFHDLGGTFGFGLDETLLGQMAADNFELWPQ
ncbi:hypothetical protein BO94DRAFT_628582 [Aspergillus sclerotioniger CBS 115572]|uniref:Zn(2)-C6 fungal-type domain-containing protein n=1 Tax=Aspergillus sclerotioniger CBS 115572 TaxID=1450535 RepID=A0A317V4S4_9EURO|nr:hypothetical protein BO94DRAFT_628582 [Aspergillus sclerotioniger CBS 115572]PWY68976.1 hypothetical protein BO94DRAFT_628582 [Aspergillus sclerotioniger CBS 115572]